MYSIVQIDINIIVLCSVSSSVSQAFLQPVLESFMNSELQVRLAALQAIILILRQGLVHPAQVSSLMQFAVCNLRVFIFATLWTCIFPCFSASHI